MNLIYANESLVMRMANIIPELEDLVDTGIVTKDTALAIIKNLSEKDHK